MKTRIIMGMFMATTMLMTSCATIFTGTKQKVTFKSNVSGTVYQNLKPIGKTNERIKVSRKDLVKLYTIKSDGCADKQFELKVKTNPMFFLNMPIIFAFGYGIITAYVDVVLGSNLRTDKIIEADVDCGAKK